MSAVKQPRLDGPRDHSSGLDGVWRATQERRTQGTTIACTSGELLMMRYQLENSKREVEDLNKTIATLNCQRDQERRQLEEQRRKEVNILNEQLKCARNEAKSLAFRRTVRDDGIGQSASQDPSIVPTPDPLVSKKVQLHHDRFRPDTRALFSHAMESSFVHLPSQRLNESIRTFPRMETKDEKEQTDMDDSPLIDEFVQDGGTLSLLLSIHSVGRHPCEFPSLLRGDDSFLSDTLL